MGGGALNGLHHPTTQAIPTAHPAPLYTHSRRVLITFVFCKSRSPLPSSSGIHIRIHAGLQFVQKFHAERRWSCILAYFTHHPQNHLLPPINHTHSYYIYTAMGYSLSHPQGGSNSGKKGYERGVCHQASVSVSASFRMSSPPPLFYYYYAVLCNFAFNVTFCHLFFPSRLTVFFNKIFA